MYMGSYVNRNLRTYAEETRRNNTEKKINVHVTLSTLTVSSINK